MPTENPAPRTAVIGLGAMGLPMARRLAAALPVTVFDIAAERRALVTAEGAAEADTPAGAARDADVVLLAVRDQAQVDAALFGTDCAASVLRPGAVVVLTSTVGPEAARATADRLAELSVHLVDAPVSGGPTRAGNGDLLIVVGAAEEARALAAPVLLRAVQGSTTVALVTTAGLVTPLLARTDLSPQQLALVCLAMGAGGLSVSHINDAGYWMFTKLVGLDVVAGLRTWTVLTTAMGLIGFALTALLWQVM
ncbi:GntT/GntP/DsdX family permease [Streptomyces purpurogeneiscleroticus]|uniref:GntT/GntP/DsdX family permease n=1 Tax=Streptomyces purpurogeneiscleroticus TaxID=68259 RepID=UPI001CBFCBF1|nr:NAD(P)-binding domain-containing protein [Streptomyces purpurogeneiscleroticus]